MIAPEKVRARAAEKEDENLAFRRYLKNHADEDELDAYFQKWHVALFADFDCSKCRNCCTMYRGSIPREDVARDAAHMGMTEAVFVEQYLQEKMTDGNYETKHEPCDFLTTDGACALGDCKPDSCKTFPYTDQPGRLFSLYSVLSVVEVCPVAFEIFERVKEEYHWRYKKTALSMKNGQLRRRCVAVHSFICDCFSIFSRGGR